MNNEINDKLNHLIARNYDAEKGFKEAMTNVDNILIKDYLEVHAAQRYDFGHELKEEIKKENGDIEKGTTLLGDAHRVWMDIKSTVVPNDNIAILEECKRGEKKAMEDYEDVLKNESLSPSTKKVLQKHRESITNNIAKIDDILNRIN